VALLTRARTFAALGLRNVGRVAAYRAGLRLGVHPVQRLRAPGTPRGTFFRPPPALRVEPELARHLPDGAYFGWLREEGEAPPDWHRHVVTGTRADRGDAEWFTLPDFDEAVGDIKGIWEPSRLDWVLRFAQRAVLEGDAPLARLNAWLDDWSAHNPPWRGHNWKCAQEASIRVLHLAVAARLLDQVDTPAPPLVALLEAHLRRIAPTIAYARAQDNNHGTSEAAALFVGGSWLARAGVAEGERWQRRGRRLLAERALRLFAEDGSFSQHSVNYHRLTLDTYSLAELWRRELALPAFDDAVTRRLTAAMEWLRTLTDPRTGDAPNLGGNDGANLLPLTDADYRDYRPAVQLAAALFAGRRAYAGAGPWDAHLRWLGVQPAGELVAAPVSRVFDDGGYAVLHRGDAMALLRYARFRFRPSHADVLHLDFWLRGENLLRDAGSFGYNAGAEMLDYFTGAQGHSTVQVDGREQMPRLGRFLWGGWLRTAHLHDMREVDGATVVGAAYRDAHGAVHARRVELRDDVLRVRDAIAGRAARATVRWRLRPGAWRVEGHTVTDGEHHLTLQADVPITRFALVDGWESRYYLRRTVAPVLEVEVGQRAVVTSEYRWSA